jgi:alkylation response protein AidB-like acyl-CoA dehydrogenase
LWKKAQEFESIKESSEELDGKHQPKSTGPTKAMASQAAWQIATWCLEIHGGHGYMKEVGVEKLVRDAAAFLHSDGVNRTLFLKAANFMFK